MSLLEKLEKLEKIDYNLTRKEITQCNNMDEIKKAINHYEKKNTKNSINYTILSTLKRKQKRLQEQEVKNIVEQVKQKKKLLNSTGKLKNNGWKRKNNNIKGVYYTHIMSPDWKAMISNEGQIYYSKINDNTITTWKEPPKKGIENAFHPIFNLKI